MLVRNIYPGRWYWIIGGALGQVVRVGGAFPPDVVVQVAWPHPRLATIRPYDVTFPAPGPAAVPPGPGEAQECEP